MKKAILITIISLLLTGCTVNYDLNIEDNNFKETITGEIPNNMLEQDPHSTDINAYNYLLNYDQHSFINSDSYFYNKSTSNENNLTSYKYSYTFNDDNFVYSRILNECFDEFNFKNEDNKYHISVSGNFKCYYADKININVKSKYQVIAHNAESFKKNTYSWTIEKENSDNIDIFLVINKNKNTNSSILNWSKSKTITLIIITILSGIAIFLGKKFIKE